MKGAIGKQIVIASGSLTFTRSRMSTCAHGKGGGASAIRRANLTTFQEFQIAPCQQDAELGTARNYARA